MRTSLLRTDQKEMIAEARGLIRRGCRRILLQAPTGFGKTFMIGFMIAESNKKNKRSVFIVPSREILSDASQSMRVLGIDHGLIRAGIPPEYQKLAQIATVQTLQRRLTKVAGPDFVVVDEAHHTPAAQWQRVLNAWPDAIVVGLTATPCRLDGQGLRVLYDAIIQGPTVRELISRESLSDYDLYAPPAIDLKDIKTERRDYRAAELGELMGKSKVVGSAIEHYRKKAAGKRALIGCVTIAQSQKTVDLFLASGIKAAHVDGKMASNERDIIISRFSAGDILILSQVGIVNEGVDIPGIEAAISLRPTQRLSLWLQFAGRALRYVPGKKAIILDHAGNTERHGPPCQEREWTLDGTKEKKTKEDESDVIVKVCGRCYLTCLNSDDECPECGYVFPEKNRGPVEIPGELTKYDLQQERSNKRKEVSQARTEEDLRAIAKARGYKMGWVKYIMRSRQQKRGQRVRQNA